MNKKGFLNWIIGGILIILLIVLGGFVAIQKGYLVPNINSSSLSNDLQININSGQPVIINSEDGSETPIDQFDLCEHFTDNYGAYTLTKQVQCLSLSGSWMCKRDKIGCYNIPSWNSTLCNTDAQAQALKALCVSLKGNWLCNPSQIACEI